LSFAEAHACSAELPPSRLADARTKAAHEVKQALSTQDD
jgi:hypothetical protein